MAEPVSLDTAKLQCRVLDDSEDDLFEDVLIPAARQSVENMTGCVLVQREIVERRDCFGTYIELYRRPVVEDSVEVAYSDTDGADQDYANFVAQTGRDPARIYPAIGGEWPILSDYGGVVVTYTAGYDEGEVPPALIQAMLLLIGHWYDNREAVAIGDISNEIQLAVQSLCGQFWRPVA